MFGFLGKILGSDKAITATINTVSNGLDKLYYSDEEKAEDIAKARSSARTMVINWMQSTQGQNLARRVIALIVTIIWALPYFISLILYAIIPFCNDKLFILSLEKSAIALRDNSTQAQGAMMLVLAFYFAAPHMDLIVSKALNKFNSEK